jgi:hypothetical protein
MDNSGLVYSTCGFLPRELWENVISYVPKTEMDLISKVCRLWVVILGLKSKTYAELVNETLNKTRLSTNRIPEGTLMKILTKNNLIVILQSIDKIRCYERNSLACKSKIIIQDDTFIFQRDRCVGYTKPFEVILNSKTWKLKTHRAKLGDYISEVKIETTVETFHNHNTHLGSCIKLRVVPTNKFYKKKAGRWKKVTDMDNPFIRICSQIHFVFNLEIKMFTDHLASSYFSTFYLDAVVEVSNGYHIYELYTLNRLLEISRKLRIRDMLSLSVISETTRQLNKNIGIEFKSQYD